MRVRTLPPATGPLRLTFLDCSCLGALVQAHHLAAHGTLRLTGVGHPVERLLTLSDLGQTLFTSF